MSDKDDDGEVAGPSAIQHAADVVHSAIQDVIHSVDVKLDEGSPACEGAEHVCDLCTLMFGDSQSLINHIMVKHSAKDINDMF